MFIVIVLIILFGGLTPTPARAAVGFEQQINIIDQSFSTTTATVSAEPTDSRLGIVHWDDDNYTGATVYFEAVIKCVGCTGGNTAVKAGLYSPSGGLVDNSTVTTLNSTDTLVRSTNAITGNLTDDTDYNVRIFLDATTGTASIKAARLIIIQSASVISHTETQIEIGNAAGTTNTAYELISGPKIFRYNASGYAPVPTISFEATLMSSPGSGAAYAALSSASDCSTTVSGSEVTSTGAFVRARSGSITLTDQTSYFVCIKAEAGETASLANAKIVLNQVNTMGISKVELYHQMINAPVTDNDATYTLQSFPITYDPDHYTGARFVYYFESVIQANSGTAYSQLYNVTDNSTVSSFENSATTTSYTLARSPEITSDIPTETKNFDTQIKNSATNTTIATASNLVIQLFMDPAISFAIEAVPSGVATNGIITTNVSQTYAVNFGYLSPGTPEFIAHKLTVATTAGSGYSVTTKFLFTLQGNYPANVIQEFPASWTAPEVWRSPDGTSPNVNSGWVGANTSDTRVPDWSAASGKFGGLGTTAVKVMQSTGVDSGTDAYVTYGIEINEHQPTDTYMGTLVYNVLATY